MKRIVRPLLGLAAASALVLGVTSAATGHVSTHAVSGVSIPNFSAAQLLAPAGNNWIVQEGNLFGQRNSSLSIITPMNISGMTEAWHVKLTETRKQAQPALPGEAPQLEYNGVLFTEDEYGGVYALNATTGQQIWEFSPRLPVYHIPASDGDALFKPTNATEVDTRSRHERRQDLRRRGGRLRRRAERDDWPDRLEDADRACSSGDRDEPAADVLRRDDFRSDIGWRLRLPVRGVRVERELGQAALEVPPDPEPAE